MSSPIPGVGTGNSYAPNGKYMAGFDKKGNPKPCAEGYDATGVDPNGGTICERIIKSN